jgi:hypothetical protein
MLGRLGVLVVVLAALGCGARDNGGGQSGSCVFDGVTHAAGEHFLVACGGDLAVPSLACDCHEDGSLTCGAPDGEQWFVDCYLPDYQGVEPGKTAFYRCLFPVPSSPMCNECTCHDDLTLTCASATPRCAPDCLWDGGVFQPYDHPTPSCSFDQDCNLYCGDYVDAGAHG